MVSHLGQSIAELLHRPYKMRNPLVYTNTACIHLKVKAEVIAVHIIIS